MGNAGTSKRGRLVEWVEKASFDRLNKLFEITAAERHYQTLLTAQNLFAVVREPQPYVTNILPRRLPKRVVPGEHLVLKDLPFYERAREVRQEHLDQREEKRQEGTLRKAPGEKGHDSSPTARLPATKEKKKTKKTLAQVLRIVAPTPEPSSSSCRSRPNRLDHTIPEPEELEAISSSLQLETFRPGPSSPQLQPEFVGLKVVHKPEEMRDTSDLRAGLLRRHRKRLYDPIDLGPPSTKKVCSERGGEDPAPEVPASGATHPDEGLARRQRFRPTLQGLAQLLLLSRVQLPSAMPQLRWRPMCQRGFWMHRTVRRLRTKRAVLLLQFVQVRRN